MGFFNNFPYSNFHELNLNWILKEMVNLKKYIENYTAVNNVSYAGIWNIRKQYPQWSIVSDGNKTYMANKPVPAGIAISNTEYWLYLADLDPRIGTLTTEVAVLQQKVETLTEETKSISRAVFGAEHVVWFGDSYANGATSKSGKGWQVYLKNYFPESKFEGLSNGGGGFTREGYYPYTFANLVEYACSNGYVTDYETVDTVLIMGGINDEDSYASEYEGVTNFINACKSRFPNAKILCAFNSAPKHYGLNSYQGMATACADHGAYFIEISPYFNLTADDRFVSTDEIHVNDAGYENIGRMFYEVMNGYEPIFISSSALITKNGMAFRATFTQAGVLMQLWGNVSETNNDGIVMSDVVPLSLKPYGLAKPLITAVNGSGNYIMSYITGRSVAAPYAATAGSYYEYIAPTLTPHQSFQL